ncbi:MAG: hypothetical protein KG003_07915 [Bacteroidetes bacterium]|nr:hypothetical protein [Bacteroidota bacterium]
MSFGNKPIGDSISIKELLFHTRMSVKDMNDTSNLNEIPLKVISYTFVLKTNDGLKTIQSESNSLDIIKGIVEYANPGDFFFFTNIHCLYTNGPFKDREIYIQNSSGFLK